MPPSAGTMDTAALPQSAPPHSAAVRMTLPRPRSVGARALTRASWLWRQTLLCIISWVLMGYRVHVCCCIYPTLVCRAQVLATKQAARVEQERAAVVEARMQRARSRAIAMGARLQALRRRRCLQGALSAWRDAVTERKTRLRHAAHVCRLLRLRRFWRQWRGALQ